MRLAIESPPAPPDDRAGAWVNRAPVWPVAPLVPVLCALVIGIVIDSHAEPMRTDAWLGWLFAFAIGSVLTFRRVAASTLALLAAIAAAGGGYHHYRWTDLDPDDLAAVVDESPRPAWVRGIVEEVVGLRRYEGRSPGDEGRLRTRLRLLATGVSDGETFHRATGRIDVIVLGDRSDLSAGLPVQVAGRLARIAGPLNPGEFDYRAYLQAQGIRLRMTVDEPSGVMPDPDVQPDWGVGWLGGLRERSRARLIEGLDKGVAPLATALVLGQRDEIDADLNDAFGRTGTTHLLAVSGLQLQVLAVAIGFVLLLVGIPRRLRYTLVALATVGYAVLVGLSPSVARSMVMTLSFCVAAFANREPRPANTLALAGILTIAINPVFVFDVGCQLSFLAIAALFWLLAPAHKIAKSIAEPLRAWTIGPRSPLDDLESWNQPMLMRGRRFITRFAVEGMLVSAVVWAAAAPLAALRFHLFSPIGVLLNVPLVPLTSAALLLGALKLAMSALGLPLMNALDWLVGWLLKLTEWCVLWGAAKPWGHRFTPGPSSGSVLIFYGLLAAAIYLQNAGERPEPGRAFKAARRLCWLLVFVWCLPGWMFEGFGRRAETLEGEILAVGHGLAVVLQTPEGKTYLYDCGRMDDSGVGRRIIAPALWSRGLSRIDTVFLSHADQDHFNGLPDLVERFAIGEVVVPPGFADEDNPAAARLVEFLHERRVPVRVLSAPASWRSGSTRFELLHPPLGWHPEASDNARSLVLDVSSLGRRLLLTGDLDQLGLVELTSSPKPDPPIDLMLSPHHGGRTANPPWLYDWAAPRAVAVSQKAPVPGALDALTPLDQKAIVLLRTWKTGAILLRWTPEGIVMKRFLEEDAGERAE